ncbi:hypothetical protein [Alistipes finegoldii]|uniref:hypothetical protein n=1 Tax=Alistipes finegoldii TaxID=214856 RepID=UPI00242E3386|nr:hypothetical protein [Alistipes finegoldii]
MVFFSYAYHYFLAASEKMATFARNKNRATIRTGLFGQAGLPTGEPVEEQVGKQVGEQVKEQTGVQTEDRPRTDQGQTGRTGNGFRQP